VDPDERSPEPEDRVPQDSPEREPTQAQAAETAEPAPAGGPEPAPLDAGVAQEAQPADEQPVPQPEPEPEPEPQEMPQAVPMPADPNAVSAATAILGAPPPGPGAQPPGVGAVPYPYPYPYPYPPNVPVPPFGDPAAAAQYAAQYPGPQYPGPYPAQYPGYPPPPGGVAQPGMPVPPYLPQYPYAAPGGQQPMPGYPSQWPGYVPPTPPGRPPSKKRAGAIAGGAAAVILAIVVISAIALTGSHSSAGLGTSPSQSGEPTYPPVVIPTDFPTGLPTSDVPAPPGLTSFTLPASAGPYTKLTGSQAQSLATSVQSTVTAEQTTLGGPLQVGVYGNGDSSTGSLTAIVMGNVVGALPELSSTVSSGDYSTFVSDFVQTAGLQNVEDSYPGTDQASACGSASASDGSTIAECVWIDNETFCIVEFSPAITGDVTGQLNFAEYDAQELRLAIDTA
jgi:hypothetical protein